LDPATRAQITAATMPDQVEDPFDAAEDEPGGEQMLGRCGKHVLNHEQLVSGWRTDRRG